MTERQLAFEGLLMCEICSLTALYYFFLSSAVSSVKKNRSLIPRSSVPRGLVREILEAKGVCVKIIYNGKASFKGN